jgi:hypothetical protein
MDKGKLQQTIDIGMVMRQFMNHPGFDIWHKDLQAKIDDNKKEWLTAEDPAIAERIRTRAIQLNEALDLMKRRIIAGDNAAKMLNTMRDEELDLNQAPIENGQGL